MLPDRRRSTPLREECLPHTRQSNDGRSSQSPSIASQNAGNRRARLRPMPGMAAVMHRVLPVFLLYSLDKPEQAVRPVVGAGGKSYISGRSGIQTPEAVDCQRTAACSVQRSKFGAGIGIECIDSSITN